MVLKRHFEVSAFLFLHQIFLNNTLPELSVNKSVAYGLIFSQIPFGSEELIDKVSGKASL